MINPEGFSLMFNLIFLDNQEFYNLILKQHFLIVERFTPC